MRCSIRQICMAVLAAAATTAICRPAQAVLVTTVVFSDHDYQDADWSIVNSFGLVFAGQVGPGGHPGSYREVALAVGEDGPFVGQISRSFAYDPAAHGAITGITYNADYVTTNAEGGAYFALLEQSGKLYIDAYYADYVNDTFNNWANVTRVLGLNNFEGLTVSSVHTILLDHSSHPDFSGTGSPITFGYEVTAGGGGFFTSVTGIDNDPITLTVTPKASGVPELSSWAMMVIGFAGVGFAAYLRSAKRGGRSRYKQARAAEHDAMLAGASSRSQSHESTERASQAGDHKTGLGAQLVASFATARSRRSVKPISFAAKLPASSSQPRWTTRLCATGPPLQETANRNPASAAASPTPPGATS